MTSKHRLPRLLTALMGLVVILCAAWVVPHGSDLKSPPWKDRLPLFFPKYTAVDQEGRSYVVDTATTRVVAFDKVGNLRWTLEGGKRENGFFNAVGLAVDSQSNLYLANKKPYADASDLWEEVQILRYSPEGRLLGVVYSLKNPARSDDFPDYFSFSELGGSLSVIYGDGNQYQLVGVSLKDGKASLLRTVNAPTNFVSIDNGADGTLEGAALNGTLWSAPPGQDWKPAPFAGVVKPWYVKYRPDGGLLVLDLLSGKIFKRTTDGRIQTVLDSQATKGTFGDNFSLAPNGTLAVADAELERLLVSPFAGEFRAFEGATIDQLSIAQHWLTWVLSFVGGLALLTGLVLFYFFVAHRRIPLLLVQIALFVPIIIVAQIVAYQQVYKGLYDRYRGEVKNVLANAAQLGAKALNPDDLTALKTPSDLDSQAYQRLRKDALQVRSTGRETSALDYIAIYRNLGGKIYYALTGGGGFGVLYPYPLFPPQAANLFSTPGVTVVDYSDDTGSYSGGFATIPARDGTIAGVVEVGQFADFVKILEAQYLSSAGLFAIINGAISVVLVVILTLLQLRSLNTLRRITREIALGNMELPVELRSRDELGQLGRDFSHMTHRLKGYLSDITALTAASARFVPRDFIDLLEVEDLTMLKLGDQTRKEMTVLFSSILNFRKITGHMTSQGVFHYLNAYLTSVVPPIRDNKGFIDKYVGDTYMALFPQTPADALNAFHMVTRRLAPHNQKRIRSGSEGLFLSFGIHKGPLMLGIVGEEQRLEGTVISDAVNLTSRLNGLCRLYRVPCVATHTTLAQVPDALFRKIDHVMVKGKSEPVLICEPIDEKNPDKAVLLAHLPAYEAAFAAFEKGDVKTAAEGFEFLGTRDPLDTVIQKHVARCREILRTGVPEVWDPAVKFHEK